MSHTNLVTLTHCTELPPVTVERNNMHTRSVTGRVQRYLARPPCRWKHEVLLQVRLPPFASCLQRCWVKHCEHVRLLRAWGRFAERGVRPTEGAAAFLESQCSCCSVHGALQKGTTSLLCACFHVQVTHPIQYMLVASVHTLHHKEFCKHFNGYTCTIQYCQSTPIP